MNYLSMLITTITILIISINQANADNIRLGWQKQWATQGQITASLMEISSKQNNINIEFKGFALGPQVNQGALAEQLDIAFLGDQPAIALLSKSPDWYIVGRLNYFRTCIAVPINSEINTLNSLENKSLNGGIGSSVQRLTIKMLEKDNIDTNTIKFSHLLPNNQRALVETNLHSKKWKEFDGIFTFDPVAAILETENKIKIIQCGNASGVIVASKEMVKERSNELEEFFKLMEQSWNFYNNNIETANNSFSEISKIKASHEAYKLAAQIEPNYKNKNITLELTDQDIKNLKDASSFLIENKIIDKAPDLKTRINQKAITIK